MVPFALSVGLFVRNLSIVQPGRPERDMMLPWAYSNDESLNEGQKKSLIEGFPIEDLYFPPKKIGNIFSILKIFCIFAKSFKYGENK